MISFLIVLAAASTPVADVSDIDKGENKTVCKRFPPPVGTRLGERKICKSKAEWDKERTDNMVLIGQRQAQMGRKDE